MVDCTELALKKVRIQGNVIGRFATFEIEQTFKNNTLKAQEVSYNFPIVETATVTGFEVEVGERKFKGVCKEKEEAREEYQRNLAEGNSAYLLEQNAGNVFNVMVGKLAKGEEAKIKITYVDELEIIDDHIHILIPTLVAPKYKSKITEFLKYSKVDYTVDFNIDVEDALCYESIECTTHTMKVAKKEDCTNISISDYALDRDCKIEIALGKESVSEGSKTTDVEGKDVVFLSFMPEITDTYEDEEMEYDFIVDISGSMSGDKMEATKKALIECLSFLDEGDKFNIIPFSHDYSYFKEEAIEFNSKNYAIAKKYINELDAGGGTEILKPVKFALYEQNVRKTIVLFTDGEVGNEEEILSYIRQNISNSRLFTFGIGANVNSAFIRGMAKEGKGKGELITPKEKIDSKIVRTFARIQSPMVEELTIDYGKNKVLDEIKEEDTLFNYEFFNVCVRLEKLVDDITLKGKILDKEYSWTISKEDIKDSRLDLGVVYAKQKINKLEEYMRNRRNREDSNGYKKMIIETAIKFNINSKYTSFISVNEREDKIFDVPEYQETTLNVPADFSMPPMPQMSATRMSKRSLFAPVESAIAMGGMAPQMDRACMLESDLGIPSFMKAVKAVDDEETIFTKLKKALTEYLETYIQNNKDDYMANIIYYMFKDKYDRSMEHYDRLIECLEKNKEAVLNDEEAQVLLVRLFEISAFENIKKFLTGIHLKRASLGIKAQIEVKIDDDEVNTLLTVYETDKTAFESREKDLVLYLVQYDLSF